MTNKEIVLDNLSAFSDWDKSKLHFAEDVIHKSPNGEIKGLGALMEACWEKLPDLKYENMQAIEHGEQVILKFDIITADKPFPVTEWYTLENGLINRVEVYFGA